MNDNKGEGGRGLLTFFPWKGWGGLSSQENGFFSTYKLTLNFRLVSSEVLGSSKPVLQQPYLRLVQYLIIFFLMMFSVQKIPNKLQ